MTTTQLDSWQVSLIISSLQLAARTQAAHARTLRQAADAGGNALITAEAAREIVASRDEEIAHLTELKRLIQSASSVTLE